MVTIRTDSLVEFYIQPYKSFFLQNWPDILRILVGDFVNWMLCGDAWWVVHSDWHPLWWISFQVHFFFTRALLKSCLNFQKGAIDAGTSIAKGPRHSRTIKVTTSRCGSSTWPKQITCRQPFLPSMDLAKFYCDSTFLKQTGRPRKIGRAPKGNAIFQAWIFRGEVAASF